MVTANGNIFYQFLSKKTRTKHRREIGCPRSDPTFDSDFCNMCSIIKNVLWWTLSHIPKNTKFIFDQNFFEKHFKRSRPRTPSQKNLETVDYF